LIAEIQIYEEKQPNGQWLKSIPFKFLIIGEDLNIGLDNDEQVECVTLLVRSTKYRKALKSKDLEKNSCVWTESLL